MSRRTVFIGIAAEISALLFAVCLCRGAARTDERLAQYTAEP